MKGNKGITLIALIITIIVLLILAVVSINLITNGGILKNAKSAVDSYEISQEKEYIMLGYKNYQMDKIAGNGEETDDFKKVKKYFGEGKKLGEFLVPDPEKGYFKDDPESIPDASTSLEYVSGDIKDNIVVRYKTIRYRINLKLVDEEITIASVEQLKSNVKLKVDDAEIVGDEDDGWDITFNKTAHTYYLSPNGEITQGQISPNWWKLSDKDKADIIAKLKEEESDVYILATSSNDSVMYLAFDLKTESYMPIMVDATAECIYFYVSDIEFQEALQEEISQKYGDIMKIELGKWYTTPDGSSSCYYYATKLLCSLEDFDTFYNKEYATKLFESLNNQVEQINSRPKVDLTEDLSDIKQKMINEKLSYVEIARSEEKNIEIYFGEMSGSSAYDNKDGVIMIMIGNSLYMLNVDNDLVVDKLEFEKGRWYMFSNSSDLGSGDLYFGESPISMEDFTDSEKVYYKDVLQKIINSFK